MAASFRDRVSFTVPATSGNYAPERLYLAPTGSDASRPSIVGVTALIESNTATGASAEIWLLKIGGSPTTDADYFYSGQNVTSGETTIPLASWPGAQIRVKSGGTSGATVVDATADVA